MVIKNPCLPILHTRSTSSLHLSESQLLCLYVVRGGCSSCKNPLKRRLAEAADDHREPGARNIQLCTQVCGVFACLSQYTSQGYHRTWLAEKSHICSVRPLHLSKDHAFSAFPSIFPTNLGSFSLDSCGDTMEIEAPFLPKLSG